ncbi:elongator complex protein 3 [Desulfohalobium retbaense]|uniref:Radical SAM domain protein n=1 Tax=Desulfohalobium retbaense (strain ATCC 49708 / DSM 5692 / JCM 16813 / HR100) TaxID=485915 RepID=C8X525_DESRD|nr:radical SAM protein [Desulfohalobium retbaense]ACV69522.1 Radical SAM domain protein [Desulfohalobium retbaense DSM 5692]
MELHAPGLTAPSRQATFAPAPTGKAKRHIHPVFLPFQGCPGRCIYCAQDRQTGQSPLALEEMHARLHDQLSNYARQGTSLELGFFGGTFTGLPLQWLQRFLELAREFKNRGVLERVRCSTRPDFLESRKLDLLAEHDFDLVEIGIQSFDGTVLRQSQRGYTPETAVAACNRVKTFGMGLGIQLLPGLPGHTPAIWARDIEATLSVAPECLRIYPCVVIDGTPLSRLWREGDYQPWPLSQTVRALAAALNRIEDSGIEVIRMGLPPEAGLVEAILDGPWHPALGELIRSRALLRRIVSHSRRLPAGPKALYLPSRRRSQVLGHHGRNLPVLERIGLSRDRLYPWDATQCCLQALG